MISEPNLRELDEQGLLDAEKHPTTEAYMKAVQTVTSDNCPLCKELWAHANECLICEERSQQALRSTRG